MRKKAFITGITGQDGSYLAELLLRKDYEVHGMIRRSSSFNTERLSDIYEEKHKENARLFLHYGDITDGLVLNKLIHEIKPHEVCNLAAQSHVRVSFDIPVYTMETIGLGTLNILEAIKNADNAKEIRFYQASSSEMYGDVKSVPQTESTPFNPRSPYACAKVFAHYQTINYRESYGLHASTGILFNHESPRRGETFVTRKITSGIAKILAGLEKKIYLGNLEAKRDWGYAKDYVEAMWLMLQQDTPDDYVIATGETWSVKELLEYSFNLVNLNWRDFVVIDPKYYRPAEVDLLLGEPKKAKEKLGWQPNTSFHKLIKIMLEHDFKSYGVMLPSSNEKQTVEVCIEGLK
ncbi:GDP-mannose 4,6 dehydratase [Coxiella burnetii]|uniref:GDP-mannose 4,6-dehydratase n=1 Tax=Coxiella burnetii TaxID=777 RepID=UPI00039F8465|nr:GDP-mannose 4,6-dehydratase [Coxiella burnetii]AML49011.1 GDP-mannose 4,6 dehydratase [Coxiella burnetii]AML54951.1 GDP-mannose 4,6 dehydratase [Coxiella burnetii]ATN68928.1 GDP-mannose 4,6 dehydratase [Coxiella burnetii]ATN70848.1 GDP-mannose 4,6 dehydratase [Coxiella burnetii]ATN72763.1 GDP-mannose 4,6-dehydratase [Coxiella burnetii]